MSDYGYDNVELNELINDLKKVGQKNDVSNNTKVTFQYSNNTSVRNTRPENIRPYNKNNTIQPEHNKIEISTNATLQRNMKPEPIKHTSQMDLNQIEVGILQKELSMVKNELAILKRSQSLAGHPIFSDTMTQSVNLPKNFDKAEIEKNSLVYHNNKSSTFANRSHGDYTPKPIKNNFSSINNISYQNPSPNKFQYQSLTRLNAPISYSAHRENMEKSRNMSNSFNPKITISNHSDKYIEETEDCTLQPIGKGIQTLAGSFSNISKNESPFNPNASEETLSPKPSYLDLMKSVKLTKNIWLRLHASREECKSMLTDKEIGSFVIRIQSEHKVQMSEEMIFELILKVTNLPTFNSYFDENYEFFSLKEFIGSTIKGIKLIGHAIEPVFPTLDSFVMQHLEIPLGLPCCLKLPTMSDLESTYKLNKSFYKPKLSLPFNIISKKLSGSLTSLSSMKSQYTVTTYAQPVQEKLNVDLLFLGKVTVDRLMGLNAIRHAVDRILLNGYQPRHCIEVNTYCDSLSGISIIDNERILFCKKFLSASCIMYCEVDPLHRGLNSDYLSSKGIKNSKIFGVVYQKRKILLKENKVIVFAELDPNSPMEGVLKFINNNFIKQNIF